MDQVLWLDLLAIITGLGMLLYAAWGVFIKLDKNYSSLFRFTPFIMTFPTLNLLRKLNILPADLLFGIGVLIFIFLIFYSLHTIIQLRPKDGENFNSK